MNSMVPRVFALLGFLCLTSAVHVSVRNGAHGKYCFVLDSTITGSIQYTDVEQKTITYPFAINGSDVEATGKCFDFSANSTTESVSIHFLPNDITPVIPAKDQWNLHLKFAAPKGTSNQSFQLVDYHLTAIMYPEFKAPENTTTIHYYKPEGESLEWGAVDTHGFTCSNSKLELTNSSWVQFANLKVLAFALLETEQFPNTQLFEQCKMDVRTSDLVPIIVGCALAGLVIVVLVAYLIGRARAKRQGYASV